MTNFLKLVEQVPVGHWAALSKDESSVLATNPDLEEAIRRAHDAGEEEPLCYFKPDESEGICLY